LDEGRGALGYWPSYSNINPNQRANYLEWLAGGKRGRLTDIGYAFIYFYGLERRALLEKKDINLIIRLVLRLLGRYSFSESFNGYLGSFVSYIVSRVGITKFNETWFNYIFDNTSISKTEEGLAVLLAWFYLNKKPLPLNWARQVAESDHRSSRSVVVGRVSEEFERLFSMKYQKRFDQGMYLEAAAKDRAIYYTPASPTMPKPSFNYSGGPTITEAVIPNVIGLEEQFTPLVDIWSECIEDLKPLSRKVSKNIDPNSVEAYEALPESLKPTTEHPLLDPWESMVSSKKREDGFALVKIPDIARLLKIAESARLTTKQSSRIGETAGHIGYAVEPDSRITGRSYRWDDVVALFRPQGKNIISENPVYLGASLILELGLAVAIADGVVDKREVAHIGGFLRSLFMLETVDYQRLNALKRVFIHQPPSLYNIGNRVRKALPVPNLEKIGSFLIGVASSDGVIDPNEIDVLKKIYKALGIEKQKLDEILDQIIVPQKEPVVVKKGRGSKAKGEKIPPREIETPVSVITIDSGKLDEIMKDTEELIRIISEALQAGSEETIRIDSSRKATPIKVKTNLRLKELGLKPRYHIIVFNIIKRDAWDRKSLDDQLRKRGYMLKGAIEDINSWAADNFGDILIEDGDKITINDVVSKRIKHEFLH
jgi:uncharacterized tellurite resistance protein B-like protein